MRLSSRWFGRVTALAAGALMVGCSTLALAQSASTDKPAEKKKVAAAASTDFRNVEPGVREWTEPG